METDQQLIERTLGGDSAAFDTLCQRYHDQLLVMLKQKCQREDQAEDILQDTFIKSYMNLERYDSSYTFGQWVYTIARNLFIDFTRRRRESCVLIDSSYELQTPSDTPTPEERVISQQNGLQLDDILAQLPENYRLVAELRFWREYSYEEIARQLDLPLNTVKTQISRARERLCTLIEIQRGNESKS